MKKKKHVKLYNRVFDALHKDDRFVVANDYTHKQNVERMARAMAESRGIYEVEPSNLWVDLAEVALKALQSE